MSPLPAVQLKTLLVFVLLTLTSAVLAGLPLAQKPLCKAIPGTPDWPSAESWNRLNESTGGRLLRPPPPGAVCHPGQPTYDAAKCPTVLDGWSTFDFYQADPISTDWNQWDNDSCLPQQADPCSASEHNIRLVVKSSGHDYLGRSVAPNSLSIWVHHLEGLETHSSFRPKSCNVNIETSAVTTGAGSQMFELYSALDASNQTIVGGNGRMVLEIELVTPTRDIVTVNECQNQDLLWAMRGGGGSTFGILTSVTMKTFPSPQIAATSLYVTTPDTTSPYIFDVVAYVLAQYPSLSDRGVSGYSFFFQALPNLFDGGATTVGGIYMQMNLQDSTFLDYFEVAEAGVDRLVGSRLLGADVLTTNITLNAEDVKNVQPRGDGNAVLPAWRWNTSTQVLLGQKFEPLNATARAEAFELVNYALDPKIKCIDPHFWPN
ncbi:hypothetical protein B0T26DRAFT_744309 [Lasiosphaeria miniovina]|uniref:FAD-binding PCMH-type domain-containing protein n=1 Tax=Lasiosphaeria miniovina TaxID=1954250 RepID=A0AA39ZU15_9PEZI|nr:uncharacterized protein B0T26DRAFT_744309 [Lasiosphaeria miniovina]KAK0703510.1 hypothetical protein B0T26DRAFT_744309 [Lasiosphaeria miniovina]